MYASQRNSLSPTWHMLLMGLMSVIWRIAYVQ